MKRPSGGSCATAFSAIDKNGEKYSAASLRYFLRQHKGRPVDVGGRGEAADTLRLVDTPRTGHARVTVWSVRAAAENDPKLTDEGSTNRVSDGVRASS